ncbi:MAG: PEP-CTERM sorting domain-containing protein, partial [Planctomycetota bacterium]
MTRLLSSLILLATLIGGSAWAQQTVTWTGAYDGFTFEEAGNWSPAPTGGVVDRTALIDNYVIDNFGAATTAGGITMAPPAAGGDLSIRVDSASLNVTSGGGVSGTANTAFSDTLILENFADVTSQFLLNIHTELGSGALLTLNGSGNPINQSTINFGGDLSGQILSAETVADFEAEHVGKLTVDGCSAVVGANLQVIDAGGLTEVSAFAATNTATLDTSTGSLTFTNGNAPLDIASIRISSAAGSLDTTGWTPITGNADGSGNGSVDSDTWSILSQTSTLLEEAETPVVNGATLGAGQTIDFGNAWAVSPFNDISLELTLTNGITQGVPLCTVGGDLPGRGDFDVDGDIDAADWEIFRSNLLSEFPDASRVEAYFMGDLNGDLDNDLNDFVAFEQLYDAENGAGAFARLVPEPNAGLLLIFGGLFLMMLRRKQAATFVLAAILLVGIGSQSHADVVWTGAGVDPNDLFEAANWDFSNSTVTEVLEDVGVADHVFMNNATIDGGGFEIGFGDLRVGEGFSINFDNVSLDTSTAAVSTNGGIAGDNANGTAPSCSLAEYNIQNSTLNIQFLAGGRYNIDGNTTISFRGSGNPINDTTNGGPTAVVLDQGATLNFVNTANLMSGNGGANEARLIYAGDADGNLVSIADDPSIVNIAPDGLSATALFQYDPQPELSMEINTTSGEVMITNNSAGDVDLDVYRLAGTLNVNGWNSLQDQDLPGFPAGNGSGNGWEEAGGSDDAELGEVYLTGFSTLAAGESISIGNAYDAASDAQDVFFEYRDSTINSFFPCAVVSYFDGPGGIDGDFNDDGAYDCADIDALVGAIASGAAGTDFDLTGDGVQDIADVQACLAPDWLRPLRP